MNPELGGVASSVKGLHEALIAADYESEIIHSYSMATNFTAKENDLSVVHGLWQWPGRIALQNLKSFGSPYLVFPHGMLDPWFKKAYPFKHIKKQLYWWWKQRKIISNARAICFTTEEERILASQTFTPYRCREVVTGLGAGNPPQKNLEEEEAFLRKYPRLKGKKCLLYLGRFHPKKGVDLLIKQWSKSNFDKTKFALILAGPLESSCTHLKKLRQLAAGNSTIHWTGMLNDHQKWSALRLADALILPSHQENYGMVVAEACSVGKPVLLTNKVNLWREIECSKAGLVANDDEKGIERLLENWIKGINPNMGISALKCFEENLHIKNAVRQIIALSENPAT
jgi:glycosyltransferase involved in cell wall biosynthesis